MKIINLTPHNVNLYLKEGKVKVFKPSGKIARLETTTENVGCLDNGIPLTKTIFGKTTGLPEQPLWYGHSECSTCGGTGEICGDWCPDCSNGLIRDTTPTIYYIVSMLVKQANPDRTDLLTPNESVRDDKGRIIGCRSFLN